MLFVGETPLGGAGGCLFELETVLGYSTMEKTMLKVSARSGNWKFFFFAVENNQLGKPVEHHLPVVGAIAYLRLTFIFSWCSVFQFVPHFLLVQRISICSPSLGAAYLKRVTISVRNALTNTICKL